MRKINTPLCQMTLISFFANKAQSGRDDPGNKKSVNLQAHEGGGGNVKTLSFSKQSQENSKG